MARGKLKFPAPYFGGKSRVAALVWDRFGNVDNYCEPFCGSAAVLLARPDAPRIETVNDPDCMFANFDRATHPRRGEPVAVASELSEVINDADAYLANVFRSLQADPEATAEWADRPVNEADLHAIHRWLVLGTAAEEFRKRMRSDPDYYDPVRAGRWLYGICCWIGGGWCTANNDTEDGEGKAFSRGENQVPCKVDSLRGVHGGGTKAHEQRRPRGPAPGQVEGAGVIGGLHQKRPRAHSEHGGGAGGSLRGVDAGAGEEAELPQQMPLGSGACGIHAASQPPEKMPKLSTGDGMDAVPDAEGLSQQVPRALGGKNDSPGVPSTPGESGDGLSPGRRPAIDHAHGHMNGVTSDISTRAGRPQLADAYSRGRGIHGNDSAGTCAARLAWLVEWFGRLRDRLRTVRVCCGDWLRVCDSESVTTRLGVTGVFFDPPYSAEAGRNMGLYARESGTVAHDVRRYCLERGGDPMMRLALCGYRGEGHEELEKHGWDRVDWAAQGGYGNRSAKGQANRKKEAIWFSPHCCKEASLYDFLE